MFDFELSQMEKQSFAIVNFIKCFYNIVAISVTFDDDCSRCLVPQLR